MIWMVATMLLLHATVVGFIPSVLDLVGAYLQWDLLLYSPICRRRPTTTIRPLHVGS